jgi:hypothetical protein
VVTASVTASQETIGSTAEKFVSQYKTNLNALFGWALTGVNLRGEKDGFMVFHVKSHQLDNGVVLGKMDMTISKLGKTFTGVGYKVLLEKAKESALEMEIRYQLYDCEKVIRSVNATVKSVRINDKTAWVTLVAEVKLDTFYDRMITRKMYEENMSWRFVQFAENMVREIESGSICNQL